MHLRTVLGFLVILISCATHAAAPATPPTGRALIQALALYERGEHAQAEQALMRLAAQGIAAADYNLAVMHIRGEAAQPSMSEALRHMTLAAERGFVRAMVGLAQLHERGDLDTGRNLAAAYRWNLRAAEAGNAEAQVEVGTAHYLGRGAPRDMTAAAHWYREAAKSGEVGAQYLIASMYESGEGVPRDLRLARYWYEAAAGSGDVAAPGKLRELDRKLAEMP
jgi:TPR repeat protein